MLLLHGGMTFGMVAGLVTLTMLWFLSFIILSLSVFRFVKKEFLEGKRLLLWFVLLLVVSFPMAALIGGIVEYL
ncbi:hypothetical protein QNI19_31135 [Cytophagaceae bacterium DM2B3-1]|uniref:Uncharacterized protein n=1 Tax=Xanthocytophaga flava TaxID=3048013 RepID=A0ABT7CUJ4_9BACT|nr:hypothetical protein [Xanthocytophaga flavus]MDJ1467070.1 hypothetical protein [Xanthocytophaga flavus]MDJ1497434.1 hypothetical protein [Xanthocytophaga flavus]